MTKPTTYVLEIVDKSGSMHHLASDVRGGHNAYRRSLIDDGDVSYAVSLVLFSSDYVPLCTAVPPEDVPDLTTENYRCAGNTALLDAIGRTITDFEAAVPELGEGDRVLLVVQTDGQENSSREYRQPEVVSKMISDREAGGKWAAIFMGAGPDTWRQAGAMGFASSVSYEGNSAGVASSYDGLASTSMSFARGATRGQATEASGLKVETNDE